MPDDPGRGGVRSRLLLALLAVITSAGVVVAGAGAASAHDYLVSSSPAANSVQTRPLTVVRLTFDDLVLSRPAPPIVEVVGPGGRHYETGCATAVDRDVTTPVGLGPSGRYTVTWRIVSADGHAVSQSIGFAYRPPTGAGAEPGTAKPPTCTTVRTQDAGADEGGGGVSPGLVVLGIGLVTLIALVLVVSRGRRRRDAPAGAAEEKESPPS